MPALRLLSAALASTALLHPADVTANTRAPSARTAGDTAAAGASADTAVIFVELRSNNGERRGKLPQFLKEEVAKARAMGRTPFVEMGATWCGPCQALEAALKEKYMIDAFAGTYVIHLDVNEWDIEEELIPLGFDGGTIPAIFAIGADGKATARALRDMPGGGPEDWAPVIKKYVQAHPWKEASAKEAKKKPAKAAVKASVG